MIKTLFGLLVATVLFSSCSESQEPYLFTYTWKDSIVDYQLYRDSVVLRFPQKPAAGQWEMSLILYNENNKDITSEISGIYPVLNNQIMVPVKIDSLQDLSKVGLHLLLEPYDGLHFSWRENGYQKEGWVRYLYDDTLQNTLYANRYIVEKDLFIIPFHLLQGQDSAYYKKQVEIFLRDSMYMQY